MPSKEQVYQAIDGEIEYQNNLYSKTSTDGKPGDGSRSVDEFSYYIDCYLDQLHDCITLHKPVAVKLDIVRKIAALSVACMMQNGIILRNTSNTLGSVNHPLHPIK